MGQGIAVHLLGLGAQDGRQDVELELVRVLEEEAARKDSERFARGDSYGLLLALLVGCRSNPDAAKASAVLPSATESASTSRISSRIWKASPIERP